MDNVLLHVLCYSGVREVLLYSLVHPSFFTKQVWRLLCKKVLSTCWSEYKHVSDSPRRRFVEIAYRKGLQPKGLSLYSGEYIVLFAMFSRNQDRLLETIKRHPKEARSLFYILNGKKERLFYQGEFCLMAREVGAFCDSQREVVAEAEEKRRFLVDSWDVATRLLINGDEESLDMLENLFFMRQSLGGRREDSCTLTLQELVLADRDNVFRWICAYSFSRDENMLRALLKSYSANFYWNTVVENLYTINNISLAREMEREHDQALPFEKKLSCLANYYLYSGDDRGLYGSLLEVMKEKQPLTKDTNIIFEIELYEVRELLRREGIENPLTQNFM